MFAPYVESPKPATTSNHALARQRAQVSAPPKGLGNQAALRSEGVPSVVHQALRSSGQALDASSRAFFEPRFGRDLSGVRVHTDGLAAASAQAVSAKAYAVGSHVVFDKNEYSPGTAAGRRLLAHELSHVVQNGGSSATPTRISDPSDAFEVAAERDADSIMSGGAASAESATSGTGAVATLHRYTVPSTLKCADVAGWLDSNSPYAPEWAQTACDYTFNGNLDTTPPKKVGGSFSITAMGNKNLSVTASCPTDLPQWSPPGAPQQAAWSSMIATLDAHEGRHRALGQTWQGTLESKFQSYNATATGKDAAEATANITAKVQSDQQGWMAQAQAAQSKLDPFRGAVLNCPAEQAPDAGAPPPDAGTQKAPDAGASKQDTK